MPTGADPEPPAAARTIPGLLLAVAVVLVLPVAELAAHGVNRVRVVTAADWARAAAVVRPDLRDRDAVVSAPGWTDPLLRQALGDEIPLAMAGRSDLARYERLWALSIRGATPPEAPADRPVLDRRVGPVRIRRWDLGPSPVLADLVPRIPEAEVRLGGAPCRWTPGRRGRGGGLGAGPFTPGERFVCDPKRPWLWVGATVTEDLDLEPRRCVWQHPEGAAPVTATFGNVPLGDRIVLYAGLYYEHERARTGGPVDVRVDVDGRSVGALRHVDGDGWKRLEARTGAASPEATGTVAITVTSPAPRFRSLCWAATTRAGHRDPKGGS